MKTAMIVAMTADGLMGRDGTLPWHYSEDLKHFKRMTKGHAVLMGRKTFESLLRELGGPLPGRTNVVISRSSRPQLSGGEYRLGAYWFPSITGALGWLKETCGDSNKEVFIIGGSDVFAVALRPHGPFASTVKKFAKYEGGGVLRTLGLPPDRVIVTWVPKQKLKKGDTLFPFSDPRRWLSENYEAVDNWSDSTGELSFFVYVRRKTYLSRPQEKRVSRLKSRAGASRTRVTERSSSGKQRSLFRRASSKHRGDDS
jgi:dihydrofolate reductase